MVAPFFFLNVFLACCIYARNNKRVGEMFFDIRKRRVLAYAHYKRAAAAAIRSPRTASHAHTITRNSPPLIDNVCMLRTYT